MTFVRALTVFLSFGILGCTAVPPSTDEGSGRVVTIASDATFAPFHYVDSEGNVTGFDIELARSVVERLGMRVEVEVVAYDRLFIDLLAGQHQVVAATTGITAEREKRYLFSSPYFLTCQAALVRAGEDEPKSLKELTGRKVGAAGAGTSVAALALLPESVPILLSGREASEVSILDDGSVPALENHEIDALIVDEFDAVLAARRSGGQLRVLREPVALERYGFVFAPSDGDLKQRFDAAIKSMLRDGSLQELEGKFGLDRGEDWPVRLPR